MILQHDKIIGCLVGGAIGDYIGSQYEGSSSAVNVEIPARSSITDDTQLTLATCEAIVKNGRPDPFSIAEAFSERFSAGRITGVGSSTLKSLRDLSFGAHWAIAGASGEMSAGNGAAMRIAPLAFCVDPSLPEERTLVRDVASITHRNDEAIAGALALLFAVRFPGFDFLPHVIDSIPDSNTRDRLQILASAPNKSLLELARQYGASGYVADSVPLALVAAERATGQGFLETLIGIISCGGDSDTTGSMVGQIVGSKIGISGIPEQLKSIDFGREDVLESAECFADFICKGNRSESALESSSILDKLKQFFSRSSS